MAQSFLDWLTDAADGDSNVYVRRLAIGLSTDACDDVPVHNACGPLGDDGRASVRVHVAGDDSDGDNDDGSDGDNGDGDDGDNGDGGNGSSDSDYSNEDDGDDEGGQGDSNGSGPPVLPIDYPPCAPHIAAAAAGLDGGGATVGLLLGRSGLHVLAEFACGDDERRALLPVYNLYLSDLDVLDHVCFLTNSCAMRVNSGTMHKIDWPPPPDQA